MKKTACSLFLLALLSSPAWATISDPTISEPSGTFTTTASWTHTPVGGGAAPEGVFLVIVQNGGGGDDCGTSMSYGGVTMTEVALSPSLKGTGESSSVYTYFLGSASTSPGSGAQTVSVTCTGSFVKTAYVVSVEATEGDMTIVDTTSIFGVTANPSDTLSLGGVTAYCLEGGHSGVASVGNVSPPTGWAEDSEFDGGSQILYMYTYSTIAGSDVTMGASQGNDDYNILGVCAREPAAAGGARRVMVVN